MGSLPPQPDPLGQVGQISSPASAPKSLARLRCKFGCVGRVQLWGQVHGRGCSLGLVPPGAFQLLPNEATQTSIHPGPLSAFKIKKHGQIYFFLQCPQVTWLPAWSFGNWNPVHSQGDAADP